MTSKGIVTAVALLALATTAATPALAQGNGEGRRPPQGPPPEAIEACEGKQAGDSVTFTGRRGEEVAATCKEEDGQLAAVPNDKPRKDRR